MTSLKSLPVGIQTFEDIRKGNFIYIDKTAIIYEMIKEKGLFFLSRPRRFGKSLLLSTFEAIFRGKKELFKGLALERTNYGWEDYPIIRMDISEVLHNDEETVIAGLKKRVMIAAHNNSIDNLNEDQPPSEMFRDLIEMVKEKTGKQVIILIDEFDSVIVNQLHNTDMMLKFHKIFREFYRVIKSMDACVKFVFVTGISNFSKASAYSGLNHLDNITMNPKYSHICGYTQEELESGFADWIGDLAATLNQKKAELLAQIKDWYNGYQFTRKPIKVYNPFSVLQFFNNSEFQNFWYQTGTPFFLIKLIQKNPALQPYDLEDLMVGQSAFETLNVEKPVLISILYQTGYLAIKKFDAAMRIFYLSYPNEEVKLSLFENFLALYTNNELAPVSISSTLLSSLSENNINKFMETMKNFFIAIPHDIHIPHERYYQSIFYLVLKLLGYSIRVEVHTNTGSIDAVLELSSIIYIIEFKLNGTAQQALDQIHKKGYREPYRNQNKPIVLLGVEFNQQERNIVDWQME